MVSKLFAIVAILPVMLSTASDSPESLETVSARIGKSIVKGDWAAFCSDAAPSISVEEHWRAYEDYFSKDGKKWKPVLGFGEYKAVSFTTVIPTKASVSKEQKLAFTKFCKLMADAKDRHSDGWGPWPIVQPKYEKNRLDSMSLAGPFVWGTVASNLDVAVEMVQIDGEWKAYRLLVIGH
jgi:hypothetical protein